MFSSGVGTAALRRLSRKWFVSEMKRQCKYASVAVYVTRTTLQHGTRRVDTFAETCSNVDLPEESFQSPRTQLSADPPFRLVTVVTLEQPYKGVDVLLEALRRLRDRSGPALYLDVIGGGRLRSDLERMAAEIGLADRVRFTGSLPGPSAVREVTRECDLFVLASRTEGLPRALLEAMALGVPCIATSVGGSVELLDPADRFPANDAGALADLWNRT